MEGAANVQITTSRQCNHCWGPEKRLEWPHAARCPMGSAHPLAGRQSNFLQSKAIRVNAGDLGANLH